MGFGLGSRKENEKSEGKERRGKLNTRREVRGQVKGGEEEGRVGESRGGPEIGGSNSATSRKMKISLRWHSGSVSVGILSSISFITWRQVNDIKN